MGYLKQIISIPLQKSKIIFNKWANENHYSSQADAKQLQFLPQNVKFTIRSYKENEFLIRFLNLNEGPITFDLYDKDSNINFILSQFNPKTAFTSNVQETSLTGNQLKQDIIQNRIIFKELKDLYEPADKILDSKSKVF